MSYDHFDYYLKETDYLFLFYLQTSWRDRSSKPISQLSNITLTVLGTVRNYRGEYGIFTITISVALAI